MKILIVGITSNDKIRGVERVVIETMKELAPLALAQNIQVSLLAGEWQKYYDELRGCGLDIIVADCSKSGFARHAYMWWKIRKLIKEYSCVHYMNTMPIFFPKSGLVSVLIHDVAEFAVPQKYSAWQSFYRRIIVRRMIRVANKVFTVSHFSQREIVRYLGGGSHRVLYITG